VNQRLRELKVLNSRYGGENMYSYIPEVINTPRLRHVHKQMKALIQSVIELNRLGIQNGDLKAYNIVYLDKPRVIDWGLVLGKEMRTYSAFFVFNVPFGNVLFSKQDLSTPAKLKAFVKEQQSSMYMEAIQDLFQASMPPTSEEKLKETVANTLYSYVSTILSEMTPDQYEPIYRHNVDLWGIISIYADFPLFVPQKAVSVRKLLAQVYRELFSYPTKRIDMTKIFPWLDEIVRICS
jgi:hypothetical protein